MRFKWLDEIMLWVGTPSGLYWVGAFLFIVGFLWLVELTARQAAQSKKG